LLLFSSKFITQKEYHLRKLHFNFYKTLMQSLFRLLVGLCLPLTARQYREVVLPDAASGLNPGTLARSPERSEGSRCKEGMAHFLPSKHRVLWPLRASRYRVVKEIVNYPGAVKLVEGSGAVRVCQAVLTCLGSRNRKQKV
jgi:hypothetical protein